MSDQSRWTELNHTRVALGHRDVGFEYRNRRESNQSYDVRSIRDPCSCDPFLVPSDRNRRCTPIGSLIPVTSVLTSGWVLEIRESSKSLTLCRVSPRSVKMGCPGFTVGGFIKRVLTTSHNIRAPVECFGLPGSIKLTPTSSLDTGVVLTYNTHIRVIEIFVKEPESPMYSRLGSVEVET